MPRTITFQFGSDMVIVTIDGNSIKFGNIQYGAQLAAIEGLKLDHAGVIKEHPDLENNEEWRRIAAERFRDKIRSLQSEQARADYIISDLSKHGYIPKQTQINGQRIKPLDGNII